MLFGSKMLLEVRQLQLQQSQQPLLRRARSYAADGCTIQRLQHRTQLLVTSCGIRIAACNPKLISAIWQASTLLLSIMCTHDRVHGRKPAPGPCSLTMGKPVAALKPGVMRAAAAAARFDGAPLRREAGCAGVGLKAPCATL
jgi:hypothetical protein